MQVWRHLQKRLQGNRREQQANDNLTFSSTSSPSSSSGLQIGGFAKQQSSASVFYVTIDDDDVSVFSLTGTELDHRSHAMEKNSFKGLDQTLTNSQASDMNNVSSTASADVVKPTLLPKPSNAQKPKQEQQQQIVDSTVNEKPKQSTGLIKCRQGTLYPSRTGTAPQVCESTQETAASATKPLPPVCYLSGFKKCFFIHFNVRVWCC